MQKKNYLIWEHNNLKVVVPSTSPLDKKEGTYFLVLHKKTNKPFWKISGPKPIIECGNLALGIAQMLIQEGSTPDFWVNIQWNARRFFNKGVSVLGRNPLSKIWGEPIDFANKLFKKNYSVEYISNLRKVCDRYCILWENYFSDISFFSKGVKEFPLGSKEFLEAEKIFFFDKKPEKKKDVIWVNEKFILTMPRKPHLTGFHFQLFPRLKYWDKLGKFRSPWQLEKDINSFQNYSQIQGYLEMTALLFGIIRILGKRKTLNFHNPEIHFSGNWNKDLLPEEKGGKLSLNFLKDIQDKSEKIKEKIIKKEKEKYLVGGPKEFQTVGHAHLYATFSKQKFVKLPPRPKKESSEKWRRIMSLKEDKRKFIRDLLQNNLTHWLEKYKF